MSWVSYLRVLEGAAGYVKQNLYLTLSGRPICMVHETAEGKPALMFEPVWAGGGRVML